MAGPAGDDSRVSVRGALRTAQWPGPAAPVLLTVLLAGTLLAGCGSGGPAVGVDGDSRGERDLLEGQVAPIVREILPEEVLHPVVGDEDVGIGGTDGAVDRR